MCTAGFTSAQTTLADNTNVVSAQLRNVLVGQPRQVREEVVFADRGPTDRRLSPPEISGLNRKILFLLLCLRRLSGFRAWPKKSYFAESYVFGFKKVFRCIVRFESFEPSWV